MPCQERGQGYREVTLLAENNVMLKPKDCGSDTQFISFVSLNKFLYIPKSQFPHL